VRDLRRVEQQIARAARRRDRRPAEAMAAGALRPRPHSNASARTVPIRKGEAINARALTDLFRHIIANDRAGGWRTLKTER
jgi:hypothetical protein